MKREFLQNLKAGDQELPKEVIDAIMAENGRDIEAAKRSNGDHEALKEQLEQAREKYDRAVEDHKAELAQAVFAGVLQEAVFNERGRNVKAITALLDVKAIQESEDPRTAAEQAVRELKKEHGYLFCEDMTPPPYARGTGTAFGAKQTAPAGLAGALREKFERK